MRSSVSSSPKPGGWWSPGIKDWKDSENRIFRPQVIHPKKDASSWFNDEMKLQVRKKTCVQIVSKSSNIKTKRGWNKSVFDSLTPQTVYTTKVHPTLGLWRSQRQLPGRNITVPPCSIIYANLMECPSWHIESYLQEYINKHFKLNFYHLLGLSYASVVSKRLETRASPMSDIEDTHRSVRSGAVGWSCCWRLLSALELRISIWISADING